MTKASIELIHSRRGVFEEPSIQDLIVTLVGCYPDRLGDEIRMRGVAIPSVVRVDSVG